MELDSFLASPRWDILQIIAKNPSSPIEIAAKVGTTVSFVSQQLKLLEAAGIVSKKRTGLVEKGKPRTLFSLAREIAYVVPLSREFSRKRTVRLSVEHKVVLKIWELEDVRVQNAVQRVFWLVHPHLDKIDSICVYVRDVVPKVYFVSKEKNLFQKLKGVLKGVEQITFHVINSPSEIAGLGAEFFAPVYDPSGLFENETVLKGGVDKNE